MFAYIGRSKTPIQLDQEDHDKLFVKGNFFNVAQHGYVRCLNYIGFIKGRSKYTQKYLHRMILNAPDNLLVDHINGDRLDNRKMNLRLCTNRTNARNKKAFKGNFKGVHYNKISKRWIAQITKDYKTHSLGSFTNEKEAALVYNNAAKKLHGKYAFMNRVQL